MTQIFLCYFQLMLNSDIPIYLTTGCLKKKGLRNSIWKICKGRLKKHWIFKICVYIPHNYPLIMGDRQKNFEDLMFFLKCPCHSFYIQFLNPCFFRHPVDYSIILHFCASIWSKQGLFRVVCLWTFPTNNLYPDINHNI